MNTYNYAGVSREVALDCTKRLLVDSIWKEANIELSGGITFPETNEIFEGRVPENADVEKVIVVNNLKRAWKFLFEQIDYEIDYQTVCEYNNIIGQGGLYLKPGELRQAVVRISGTDYIPQIHSFESVRIAIASWKNIVNPVDKALEAFCSITREQWFNNGNKRTAQLVANHILLHENVGIFSISDTDSLEFCKRLVQYYETENSDKFKGWLYERAVGLFPSGLTPSQLQFEGSSIKNTSDKKVVDKQNTSDQTSSNSSEVVLKSRKITREMVRTVYEFAKKVYNGELKRIEAIHKVSEISGINDGSAQDYINNYRHFRSGEPIKRMMKVSDIEMYLQWIKEDESAGEYKAAKKTVAKSIEYWKTLENTPNLKKLDELLNK